MMFSDLLDKINALYGYTPSQSNLLQNPELLDMAIMAIAANVSDLSAIATAYNTLMGTSLTASDLIAQPDKTKLGILAIASSTTSLSALATSYNTLMGINFTASSILLRPDLVRVAMLAVWAAVTDLATLTAKVNALMGWTPTNAQLLNNSQLLEIALAAVIGGVNDLSAIATEYNAVMGTSFSGSDLLASPEKIVRGAFFLVESSSLHPDTQDWLGRVALAGGSVSPAKQILVDAAINQIYTEGLRGGAQNLLLYLLALNVTESFAGSLVPIYGSAVNHGFVAGDWSPTLGLTGGGTKWIDTLFNPNTEIGVISNTFASIHISAWITGSNYTLGSNSVGIIGGAADNVNYADYHQIFLDNDTTEFSINAASFATSDIFGYGLFANGLALLNRQDTSIARLLINDTLVDTITGIRANASSPDFTYPLFAINDPSVGVTGFAPIKCSAFTIGRGLTVTQQTKLYQILGGLN